MLTPAEVLEAKPPWHSSTTVASTGFVELDAITGGFRSGQVWLLLGGPGQGRTTLLHQWAASTACAGVVVDLVAQRSSSGQMAARLAAAVGTIPLSSFQRGVPIDAAHLALAKERLQAAPLNLWPSGEDFTAERWEPRPCTTSYLAIDDAEQLGGVSPGQLNAWARRDATIVASLPRDRVALDDHPEPALEPRWAGCADVVLEVRHRGLPGWPWRPGEAEIDVLMNRHGPCRTLTVGFHGHYSRFVDQAVRG